MTTEMIILIVVASVLFVVAAIMAGALFILSRIIKNMRSSDEKVDKVKVVDGVRYTKDDVVERGGEMNITHNEGDVTLSRGEEYEVVKGGKIMPGKYQVLSADGSVETLNIRIGGFVREIAHNTPIVLEEGDKICAVSHTVILR